MNRDLHDFLDAWARPIAAPSFPRATALYSVPHLVPLSGLVSRSSSPIVTSDRRFLDAKLVLPTFSFLIDRLRSEILATT
jgi:hypothetical protein